MKKTITMSVKDFLKEHKRLISRLRNPDPQELEEEAKTQEAELKEYGLEDEDDTSVAKMPLDKLKQTIQSSKLPE